MIRHTVVFSLVHASGSPEEADFLRSAQSLAAIATVQNFECLRQVGKKNPYSFGLSMEFEDEAAYQFYNAHPKHLEFVQFRRGPEVRAFMEIDYEPLSL